MTKALYQLLFCAVFVSVVSGLAPTRHGLLAAEDARLPAPPQEKVEEALALIRDAYEADYRAAKESGEPEQLIAQLNGLASGEADPVRKYALFVEAENVASAHDNFKKAVELLDARAELFRIDGLALRSDLLKRLAGPKVSADLELCDQAMDTAQKAMRSERFDLASEAAALAVSIAKAVDREQKAAMRKQRKKDGGNFVAPPPIGVELVKKSAALQAQVMATEKLFEQYGDAVQKAKSSPDSPSANAVIGSYLCFVREDWKAGLPALVKSDLKEFSALAANDLELAAAPAPMDAQKAFELAGKWWTAAESKGVSADHESAIKDHAASLYADAADRLTSVLEKRLAVSRLRGLAKHGASNTSRGDFTNSIGIKMRLIPSGAFHMGSDDHPSQQPVHEVRITRPFYIGLYEITNTQWQAVMGAVPSRWKDDNRPVEQVNWHQAVAFCKKLSDLPAEKSLGHEYRLPTEAEWEYACRACSTTRYSFGDDASQLGEYAWLATNSGLQTHPVGEKQPNAWGLFDIHGNVWEWCSDNYGSYDPGSVIDPAGPEKGVERVARGNGWGCTADAGCASSRRGHDDPSTLQPYLGLRIAMSKKLR
jgi:formylglycine-generating enzyme required for sulfatase activity